MQQLCLLVTSDLPATIRLCVSNRPRHRCCPCALPITLATMLDVIWLPKHAHSIEGVRQRSPLVLTLLLPFNELLLDRPGQCCELACIHLQGPKGGSVVG
jgi:hypothetical protein